MIRWWSLRTRVGARPQAVAAGFTLLVAVATLAAHGPQDRPPSAQVPTGMVRITGGTFVMGTDPTRIDPLLERFQTRRRELFLAEIPARRVRVDPFLMDRTEVTNGEFQRFVTEHQEWSPGRVPPAEQNGDYLKHWIDGTPPASEGDLPVTFVTWMAAVAYCEWQGRRLPTEAEWEFAAGGGDEVAEFPWGNEPPDSTRANWSGAGLGRPAAVGSFAPNAHGLYDMAGNVWEFVDDLWVARGGEGNATASSAAAGDRRVIRGGSYGASAINLRVRYRDSHPANGAAPHVGFRCAATDGPSPRPAAG